MPAQKVVTRRFFSSIFDIWIRFVVWNSTVLQFYSWLSTHSRFFDSTNETREFSRTAVPSIPSIVSLRFLGPVYGPDTAGSNGFWTTVVVFPVYRRCRPRPRFRSREAERFVVFRVAGLSCEIDRKRIRQDARFSPGKYVKNVPVFRSGPGKRRQK